MKNLRAAFSFLTVLRIPGEEPGPEELAGAPAWFPVVGVVLGLGILAIAEFGGKLNSPRIAAFLAVLFLAGITRGLHLDGLADWADSFGGKDSEERLRIMAEPGIGSFGMVALVLLLVGKYLCLAELFSQQSGYSALLLAPVLSRWMLSYFLVKAPYARKRGIATVFKERLEPSGPLGPALLQKASAVTLASILIVSPVRGLLYWGWGFLVSELIYYHAKQRIGGITGDVLGAMAEVSEFAILALACLV
jgi:adenosylcobinamide-GDP ribazoletransferase